MQARYLSINFQATSSFICGIIFGIYVWFEFHVPLNLKCSDDGITAMRALRVKNKATSVNIPDVSEDNFLFIGIMTARKYLDSRAFASSKTWVSRVPGKVVYFLGEGDEYTGDLNVIQLKGITEDDYPPQKKSFAMVEYMSEHFAKDYKWFIRADDDMYIKVDELVKFLKSIDDKQLLYIGQPGFGKSAEQGKLGLMGSFCMGGPGVIMTSKLVTSVAPRLKECIKVTVTEHEDTELGRCITLSTGVQCTIAFQMKELFYQNYAELDLPNSSFKKSLGRDELRALTLHPIKDHAYMFRLDNFFNQNIHKKLTEKVANLKATLDTFNTAGLGNDVHASSKDNIVGSSQPQQDVSNSHINIFEDAANRRDDVETHIEHISLLPKGKSIYQGPDQLWEFIRYKTMYSARLETGKLVFPVGHKRRHDLHQEMVKYAMSYPQQKRIASKFVNETYQRMSTNRGVEVMLFIKTWNQGRKSIQPIYLRKPLQSSFVDFRETDDERGDKEKTIYILMPLFQRSSIYKRFLGMHASAVKGYKGKVQLRLVLFIDDIGEHNLITAMTSSALNRNPHLDITIMYREGPFNRGKGLMTALGDLPISSLLLFMDVDMEYSSHFLHRVSKYTVMGRSTFFPVYFVHYNPDSVCYKQDDCDTLLNSRRDEVGLWRSFSFGIGAVYKSDLIKAGGFKTDIEGWGLEDVDFFEKCIAHGLEVIRSSDPSIIHRYHPRECNMSLPETQLQQCVDSGSAMLGSVKNLYRMLNDIVKEEVEYTGH